MLSVPIKVIIKTESTEAEGLKDIIEKIEGIKEKNPHTVIDTTIEIDLRSDPCKVTPTATTYDYQVQLTTST